MTTKGKTMGSFTIARAVSGPYRAQGARRAPTLTSAGMFLSAVSVIAIVAAVLVGSV
jgi:hypothetical protein